MTELRPYQADVTHRVHERIAAGVRRLLIVAPTGSGKIVIASRIVADYVSSGRSVLFLAHRREIVRQTSRKLDDNDISHGIIMAGHGFEPVPVQVASVATLHARAIRGSAITLPPADLLVIDEAHHATARTWRKIAEAYPNAVTIGMTATPCRGDGRGLGGMFDELVECPQVQELIADGFLVKTRCFAPDRPDLNGVRVHAGDYVERQLAERMDQPKLVGDIVAHWHRLAEGRRTVVFATGVRHSVHIRDEFMKSGVACEHLDGSMPKDDRDAILARLGSGETKIVTNCMVLTEGWDMPDVGCAVLARPTKKMGLYRQIIGRVLRPADGKPDAIVIDHSGAVFRHGFAEDPVAWTLDPEKHAKNPMHESRGESGTKSRLVDCLQCGALRTGGEACRHCGWKPAPKPMRVDVIDGDLGLVTNGKAAQRIYTLAEKHAWHRQLLWIQQQREYSLKWAKANFHEKFGEWRDSYGVEPQPATYEVVSWVKSRQIAYAKSRQRAA